MSNWELKSEMSFKASNKLLNESCFNASVHSSYYSCVQFMLHILGTHFGKSDEEIDDLHNATSTSVHQHLKKTIFQSLRTHNPDFAVEFNTDINTLNLKRNTADYLNEIIEPEEAKALRQRAYNTLEGLKMTYNSI